MYRSLFISAALLSTLMFIGCRSTGRVAEGNLHDDHHAVPADTPFETPDALQRDHEAIHVELRQLRDLPGETGEAARRLAATLRPHFEREEEIAMPPLALLLPLSRGEFDPSMADVLPLTDSLHREMPQMLEEHQQIVVAINALTAAAEREGHERAADFARKLRQHAQVEEQILYPAALLVGEVVRTRLHNQDTNGDVQ